MDENMPAEAAALFREAGHDVASVLEEGLGGKDDAEIFAVCRQEERSLVTLDLDFADIRTYPPAESPGIVIIRLQRQDTRNIQVALHRHLSVFENEPLPGQLWILEEERVRIRGGDA
jgi:predicted nuclease of predicted toxin-antitoxin system